MEVREVTSPPFGGLLLPGIVVAVVYAATAKVGLMLAFAHPSATAVWPPTGIALAALLLRGYGIWPAVLELVLEEQRAVPHMAALVEASDDAIFSTRLDGTILSWSKEAERLFG